MFSIEELKARQQGLGASEISAVLGLSPYKSRYELYIEKTTDDPARFQKDTPATAAGRRMEEVIALMYEEDTGHKTRLARRVVHPDVPYLFATPDRLVTLSDGGECGLEIKNVGTHRMNEWGPRGSFEIPDYYYTQIAACMMAQNMERWDVAALLGGSDLRIYTFRRNAEFESFILEESDVFWRQHVEKRIPPSFETGELRAKDFMKRLYPAVESTTVALPEEALLWAQALTESKKMVKQYETHVKWASNQILQYMGSHERGVLPNGSCFVRKRVNVSGHYVPARTDVRLEYKTSFKNKDTSCHEGTTL